MYKISVPVNNDAVWRFGKEKTLKQLRRFDAERVFVSIESYSADEDVRKTQLERLAENAAFFRDGDLLSLKDDPAYTLRVIHTPGHTPDSSVFYDAARGTAFVGDTIFRGSRGNDRLPGGDGPLLLRSIREKVLALPPETVLYSGHSDPTTVAEERPLYL